MPSSREPLPTRWLCGPRELGFAGEVEGGEGCYAPPVVARLTGSDEELWQELERLPEHLKGEIIDGRLYVQPRPRPRHARGIGYLGHHLGGAFDYDEDGPGGWWIVPEPGIELERAPEVAPDLAGWRRERLPELPPEGEPFRLVPDWICEVLSPSNARYDRQTKAPYYASVGVHWLCLVDLESAHRGPAASRGKVGRRGGVLRRTRRTDAAIRGGSDTATSALGLS